MEALIKEIISNVDKISPSMDKAICQYSPELFGEISGEGIAFGDAGYVALYHHEVNAGLVYVLAFRHQKEAGY